MSPVVGECLPSYIPVEWSEEQANYDDVEESPGDEEGSRYPRRDRK